MLICGRGEGGEGVDGEGVEGPGVDGEGVEGPGVGVRVGVVSMLQGRAS